MSSAIIATLQNFQLKWSYNADIFILHHTNYNNFDVATFLHELYTIDVSESINVQSNAVYSIIMLFK